MPSGRFVVGQPLHLAQRLARAHALRRRSVDRRRSEQVEVADDLRRGRFLHPHDLLERHHLAGARPRIELSKRLRVGPELLIGLHVDAVRAVVELEVVHVLRPEEDLQRARDLAERQPERERALTIDRDLQLRVVRGERAEQARPQLRRLVAGADNRLRRLREARDVAAALIEDLEFEAAEPAQPLDRRRREADDDRAGNAEQRSADASEHGLHRMRRRRSDRRTA